MRDYGKVQTEFWEHPGVRRLSTEGKLLYVYLLTGPHTNLSGCFKAPFGYVADDLGWVSETVSERFGELVREGFVTYDATSRFVLVHGFLKFNKIANRNIAVPLVDFFNEVPAASPLKAMLASEIVEFVDKLDEAQRAQVEPHAKRLAKPFPEPFLNPENREQGTGIKDIGASPLFGQPAAPTDPRPSTALVPVGGPKPVRARKPKAEPTAAEQQLFDQFWAAYPKKVAKPEALAAYLAIIRTGRPEDSPQAILAGAEVYAAVRAGQDPHGTKHPQGWLNGRRWEDDHSDFHRGTHDDEHRAANDFGAAASHGRRSRAERDQQAALAVLAERRAAVR